MTMPTAALSVIMAAVSSKAAAVSYGQVGLIARNEQS